MGQDWRIVNVDKKQRLNNGAKLGESLGDYGVNLFRALSEVKRIPVKEIMDSLKINYKEDRGPYTLGRLQLPVEIIDMIFSEIEDLENVFPLAVANTRLMIIGEKRLYQLMAIPCWRGDRIICIGDETTDDDLPEGIFTQECQDFASNIREFDGWAWVRWSRSGFQRFDNEIERTHRNALSKNTSYRVWERRSHYVYSGIIDKLTSFKHVFKVPHILWNLSKKVYVRLEAALEAFEGEKLADINVCGMMGNILQLQICWSSSDNTAINYKGLNRGKWAGDRFEFTDESVLRLRLRQEEGVWMDVSEEVIGKFVDVYKAEFGENWTEEAYNWRR